LALETALAASEYPCALLRVDLDVDLLCSLAYAEMRLILAQLMYNFDMQLADEDLNWLDHKQFFLNIKPALPVYLTPVKRG
jgi:hypothetical protein